MFAIKPLRMEQDFPVMVSWWEARKFPPANPFFTSGEGLVVWADGAPVCGGFLFKTNANVAIIGNLVSDPSVEKKIRSEAVDYLILALTEMAREAGFPMVSCSTNLAHLMTRYERLGFTKADEGVSHFGRILECHSSQQPLA